MVRFSTTGSRLHESRQARRQSSSRRSRSLQSFVDLNRKSQLVQESIDRSNKKRFKNLQKALSGEQDLLENNVLEQESDRLEQIYQKLLDTTGSTTSKGRRKRRVDVNSSRNSYGLATEVTEARVKEVLKHLVLNGQVDDNVSSSSAPGDGKPTENMLRLLRRCEALKLRVQWAQQIHDRELAEFVAKEQSEELKDLEYSISKELIQKDEQMTKERQEITKLLVSEQKELAELKRTRLQLETELRKHEEQKEIMFVQNSESQINQNLSLKGKLKDQINRENLSLMVEMKKLKTKEMIQAERDLEERTSQVRDELVYLESTRAPLRARNRARKYRENVIEKACDNLRTIVQTKERSMKETSFLEDCEEEIIWEKQASEVKAEKYERRKRERSYYETLRASAEEKRRLEKITRDNEIKEERERLAWIVAAEQEQIREEKMERERKRQNFIAGLDEQVKRKSQERSRSRAEAAALEQERQKMEEERLAFEMRVLEEARERLVREYQSITDAERIRATF
eukprot:g2401.t1